jgi:hypothetical protein
MYNKLILLSCTTRHFHPNLVSMEWDSIALVEHTSIVMKPHQIGGLVLWNYRHTIIIDLVD